MWPRSQLGSPWCPRLSASVSPGPRVSHPLKLLSPFVLASHRYLPAPWLATPAVPPGSGQRGPGPQTRTAMPPGAASRSPGSPGQSHPTFQPGVRWREVPKQLCEYWGRRMGRPVRGSPGNLWTGGSSTWEAGVGGGVSVRTFSSPVSLSHGDTLSQQRRGPLVRGGPGRRACERPGGPAHWSADSRAPLPQVGGTRPLLGRLRGSLLCLALHLVAQVTSQVAAEAAGYQSGNKQGNTQRGRQVPPPTRPRAFSSSTLNLPPRGADGSGPPPALAGSSPVAGEEEEEEGEDVGL